MNFLCMPASTTSTFTWIVWKYKPLLVRWQHLWEYNQHKKWNRKKLKGYREGHSRDFTEKKKKKRIWGSLKEITWKFSNTNPFNTKGEIRFIKYKHKTYKISLKILQNHFKDSRSMDFSKKTAQIFKAANHFTLLNSIYRN